MQIIFIIATLLKAAMCRLWQMAMTATMSRIIVVFRKLYKT